MQETNSTPDSGRPPSERNREQEAESRSYQNFLESLPGTIYLLHADGRFARWNPCLREIFAGRSEEEMPSVNAKEMVHPDDLRLTLEKMGRVLESGIEETVEIRLLMKGGPEYRWFLVTGNRLMIDGAPFLAGIGMDITSRKRAEQILWQSEERLRSIAEQVDIPVFITDMAGNVVYMSQAIENLSGYTREDVLGRPFARFLEGEAIGVALAMFSDVVADPAATRVAEFRLRKKDGSICFGEIKLQFYHDSVTDGTIGVIYDLTQHKRFEALTAVRLRLLQMAVSANPEELIRVAIDEAERITDSTFGFLHFLVPPGNGFSRRIWSERVRKRLSDLAHVGHHHPVDEFAFWEDAVKSRSHVICNDYVSCRPSGFPVDHHPVLHNSLAVPLLNVDGVAAVLVLGNKQTDYQDDDAGCVKALLDMVWDIVERQRAERSESRLQALLLQIQKMELVGQLAGGIAHDFNNFLGVILGNTELALLEESLDPSIRRNLEEIFIAADRSAALTSQLLAFARKQVSLPQLLDLNRVVAMTIGMLNGLIGEKIAIVWDPDENDCPVRVDPSQIDQVLTSLCLNARDAMDGSGTITIGTRRLNVSDKGSGDSTGGMHGEFVELSVADTGTGIAQEHRGHIFEPFYTTKPLGKGSGLGLSTVYGVVKQNLGFINFETESGKGSLFRVYLPLVTEGAGALSENQGVLEPERDQATILIVEDEPEILNLCRRMLEKSGFRVFATASHAEAIRLVEAFGEEIDLLLTDVIMPEMNGSQLSIRMRKIVPSLKTLFMSGYTADIVASHGVLDPGTHFIQKPFTVNGLTSKVREIFASG